MRDFLDEYRYNKMEDIAKVLKLDTSSEQTLWRDRVALELNVAILYSFQKAKVTMVDHQTASRQFLAHDLREKKAGRECPGDWGWVVPASGGSACPVWHHQMRDFYLEPAYHHAADRWAVEDGIDLEKFITTTDEDDNKQDRILILYASETGTAEGFARKATRQLQRFRPKVMALDEYNTDTLASEKLLLIVTSTFGNGEMPGNGKKFLQWLKKQPAGSLDGLNYSVLGIGSTVYEYFCAAGISVDKALAKAGANCIVPLHVKTDAGKTRQGLCSNYLAGLEPGAKVRIGVRTSGFRPPADPLAPMLMVGPGTGVSPLIAFLQYRQALLQQGTQLGDACLYFGCRDRNDFLYGEQLESWQNQGVLSGLEVAFSRLTDKKVYVQGLMQEKAQELWQLLSHPQCHYYVCGDAKMADDVFEVFMAIAKTEGGLSHIEAVSFFDKMKQEKRFVSDVWGVVLNFKQAIKEVQHDNYSKAEKWLERVHQSADSQASVKEAAQPMSI